MYEIKKSTEPFTSEILSEDDLMSFAKEISEDEIKDVEDAINVILNGDYYACLLYTSPSPRDRTRSRMPSSA